MWNQSLRQNPEYWGRAGAGILPVAADTGRFLVAFRSGAVLEPYTWGTIGGKLDLLDAEWGDELESPRIAALREFAEETLSAEPPRELIALYIYEDEDTDFRYSNYLGVLSQEFQPQANWETDAWAWLTFGELLDLEPKHFGLDALLADEGSFHMLEQLTQ